MSPWKPTGRRVDQSDRLDIGSLHAAHAAERRASMNEKGNPNQGSCGAPPSYCESVAGPSSLSNIAAHGRADRIRAVIDDYIIPEVRKQAREGIAYMTISLDLDKRPAGECLLLKAAKDPALMVVGGMQVYPGVLEDTISIDFSGKGVFWSQAFVPGLLEERLCKELGYAHQGICKQHVAELQRPAMYQQGDFVVVSQKTGMSTRAFCGSCRLVQKNVVVERTVKIYRVENSFGVLNNERRASIMIRIKLDL